MTFRMPKAPAKKKKAAAKKKAAPKKRAAPKAKAPKKAPELRAKRVKVEPPALELVENLFKKGHARGFVTEMEILHVFSEAEEYLPVYEEFLNRLDKAGVQTIDAAFIRGKVGAGESTVVDPGPLSDHKWLGVKLILGGSTL